ncbi:MAG: hypothetical protein QG559_1166, partial [Campylobacterota bacterium]|nr:hypothetical protein [Campylobacterota bacterium]
SGARRGRLKRAMLAMRRSVSSAAERLIEIISDMNPPDFDSRRRSSAKYKPRPAPRARRSSKKGFASQIWVVSPFSQSFIKEIYRILKKDGVLVLSTPVKAADLVIKTLGFFPKREGELGELLDKSVIKRCDLLSF